MLYYIIKYYIVNVVFNCKSEFGKIFTGKNLHWTPIKPKITTY